MLFFNLIFTLVLKTSFCLKIVLWCSFESEENYAKIKPNVKLVLIFKKIRLGPTLKETLLYATVFVDTVFNTNLLYY